MTILNSSKPIFIFITVNAWTHCGQPHNYESVALGLMFFCRKPRGSPAGVGIDTTMYSVDRVAREAGPVTAFMYALPTASHTILPYKPHTPFHSSA